MALALRTLRHFSFTFVDADGRPCGPLHPGRITPYALHVAHRRIDLEDVVATQAAGDRLRIWLAASGPSWGQLMSVIGGDGVLEIHVVGHEAPGVRAAIAELVQSLRTRGSDDTARHLVVRPTATPPMGHPRPELSPVRSGVVPATRLAAAGGL